MRKRVVFAAVALGLAALFVFLLANMQDHGSGGRFDAERPDAPVPIERPERPKPPTEEEVVSKPETPAPEAEKPGEATEAERGGLRVVILDAHGAPVAGAKVHIYAHRKGKQGSTKAFETDSAGEVNEPELLPGWANVHLYRSGHSRSHEATIRSGEIAEVRFDLPETLVVQGVVRHAEKGLMPRVSVKLVRNEKGVSDSLYTTTDEKGAFRLEGVPPGTYAVTLTSAEIGYSPRARAKLTVDLPGPVVKEFVVGVVRLRGRVTDPAGEPIGGVSVTLYRTNFYASSATDANGEFEVLDLPEGTYSLTMSRDGYGIDSEQIEMGEEVRDLEFTLKRAARIRFRFSDTDGNPIAGEHGISTRGETSIGTTVVADAGGCVRYDKLVAGPYKITVNTRGFRRSVIDVEVAADDNEIPIVLQRQGEQEKPMLTATLRDAENGDPIPGARVHVDSHSRTTVSDATGVFLLRNLPVRKCSFWVRKDGYGLTRFEVNDLVEDKNLKRDFRLQRAGTVHFILTDKHGKPVVGRCTLVLSPLTRGGTNVGTGVTADAEGHATFTHILPGSYKLSVHHEGAKSERVETTIHLGEQTLRLRLE